MSISLPKNKAAISLLLFVSTFLLTWFLCAAYFTTSLDEGIYTYGGHRVAAGQIVYKDFAGFIGPILYWLEAPLYSSFGNDITKLRFPIAASLGAITTGLYFLVSSVAGRAAGLLACLSWLAFAISVPNRMEVNHRWLSMGFYALAGTALIASPTVSRRWSLTAGCLLGLALFTTPSFVYAAAILGVYLYFRDPYKFLPFLLGGTLICSIVILVLIWQGALSPFVGQLRWALENYGQANHFPYGHFGSSLSARYFLEIYLGAICIPLSLVMAGIYYFWRKDLQLEFPVVFCLALTTTSYPKWDAYSLFFISAPFFGLVFAIAFSLVPEALRSIVRGLLLAFFTYNLISAWTLPDRLTRMPTRAGVLMGDSVSALVMERLENAIPRKSKVFVYPYLSALYTLLDVENPTRYEYLQPGMMTADDETSVLTDLKKRPPDFIFWQNFPDADIRRVWPGSNPDRHRFIRLEQWIPQEYEPGIEITESNIRGRVWKRKL